MGLVLLNDFEYEDEDWKNGTIYDPADGKIYSCSMWLESENSLRARGDWGFF